MIEQKKDENSWQEKTCLLLNNRSLRRYQMFQLHIGYQIILLIPLIITKSEILEQQSKG